MIDYSSFWITLQNSKETTYTLIREHGVSSSTIDRLRKNSPLTTVTLNDLCRILDCNIEDLAQYVPSEEDQVLNKKEPS